MKKYNISNRVVEIPKTKEVTYKVTEQQDKKIKELLKN